MRYRPRATTPLAERIRGRLTPSPSGCIEWGGRRNNRGYGVVTRGRREDGHVYVHRAVWELNKGPVPNGLEVLHDCDNPPCANIDHLFIGTHADNMRDMMRKGRGGGQFAKKAERKAAK